MLYLTKVTVDGDEPAEVGGGELGSEGQTEKEGIPGSVPDLTHVVHVRNQLRKDEKLGL